MNFNKMDEDKKWKYIYDIIITIGFIVLAIIFKQWWIATIALLFLD